MYCLKRSAIPSTYRAFRERCFDGSLRWIDHIWLGQLQFGELANLVGKRRVARLDPGVLSQPNHGGRTPLWRNLVIQQHTQALEDTRARIVIGDLAVFGKVVPLELQLRAVDHDFQVLPDVLVLLFRQLFLELGEDGAGFRRFGDIFLVGRHGYFFIVLAQAVRGRSLGGMLLLDIDQQVRELIAAGNPAFVGGCCGGCLPGGGVNSPSTRRRKTDRQRMQKRWRQCLTERRPKFV